MAEACSNRTARLLARRSTANYLLSIGEDAEFVSRARERLASDLPLLANLRAGAWYVAPDSLDGTCYFKSVDGHRNQWDFSLIRLNLQVARAAARSGGAVLVDCTGNRRKTLPDSLSKTVPIWCAVLQATIGTVKAEHLDSFLHLPLSVDASERKEIVSRLPAWVAKLRASLPAREIAELAAALCGRQLRACWASPHDDLDQRAAEVNALRAAGAAVILCISASRAEAGSTSYVQGAGDDEEAWASRHGLTPQLFWQKAPELLEAAQKCPQEVDALVASWTQGNGHGQVRGVASSERCSSTIGDTGMSVGDFAAGAPPDVWVSGVDAVLNCGGEEHPGMRGDNRYLMLPAADEKKHDPTKRWWQEILLPRALRFLGRHLGEGRRVLIHCARGDNRAPAVAAAALAAFFGPGGTEAFRWPAKEACRHRLKKADLRRCLVTVQCFHPHCNVPRRIMQFLNLFFVTEGAGCWSDWQADAEESDVEALTLPSRMKVAVEESAEATGALWQADEVAPALFISGIRFASSLPLLR